MHFLSALTHVYPDDIYLEKLDHLGIVCLVMGTPISTLLVCYSFVTMSMVLLPLFVHQITAAGCKFR